MGLISKMADKLRDGMRSFLRITPAPVRTVVLDEGMDFLTNCVKNRIWYSGRATQLSSFYSQLADAVPTAMFWAAPMTRGLEIRKLHTGLPKIVVDMLTQIVVNDYNGVEIRSESTGALAELWERIENKNGVEELLGRVIRDVAVVGDGALKISYDKVISDLPIIEWFPAERVRFVRRRGAVREIHFLTEYYHNSKSYIFTEIYGYGYISYELSTPNGTPVSLSAVPQTEWARGQSITFDSSVMFAVPVIFGEHPQYEGRGLSLIDSKDDAADALDECVSQWWDAIRAGRTREYFPEDLIPRNPETGVPMKPNAFDNRFIAIGNNMAEGGVNKIQTDTPEIHHESYLASYITALDIYLQGLISPSTIGIDTKKLDNAESQREKEKTTLYTRQNLVALVSRFMPRLVKAALDFDSIVIHGGGATGDFDVSAKFGEYANPSFESQVETVSKARTGGVMSVETAVDELYGDSRESDWKEAEAARIKEELGIAVLDEASGLDDIIVQEFK